ncbi:hypothetical protein [Actinoplanes sp. NPDC026619]|uniref:hypothetical protein n=1 Tax=Actinoplanes sp. NPDC026619 TaxID=3155798 RepID=UPI0033F2775C
MRKFWYAGAVVAGGIMLFGAAAPAQADLLPGTGTAAQQADDQLATLLGATDGATVENPLRYSTLGTTALGAPPLVDYKAGKNGADLKGVLPGKSAEESGHDLPAADVVGDALRRPTSDMRNVDLPQTPFGNSPLTGFFGGVPVFGGLLPNGGTPSGFRTTGVDQTESFDGGLPLLGGLGGVLPVNGLSKARPVDDAPDLSGLPAGGMDILPAATDPGTGADATPPTAASPAPDQSSPSAAPSAAADQPTAPATDPSSAATPDDPRLHEEPVDGEASTTRPFTAGGRPVAGIDPQYKD